MYTQGGNVLVAVSFQKDRLEEKNYPWKRIVKYRYYQTNLL